MHHVRFRALLVALLAVAACGIAPASTNDPTSVDRFFSTHSSASGLSLSFDVPSLSWDSDGVEGQIPVLEGAGFAGVAGAPMLPVYNRMIPAPAGMDVVIDDVQATWEEAGQFQVAIEEGKEGPVERDDEKYNLVAEESWTPVEVGSTGRWRDIRFAPVAIRPMRLDPITGTVEVATRMNVSFRYVPSQQQDSYDPPGVSEALLPLYEQLVPGSLDDVDPTTVKRGTYLMIVPDDFLEAVEPLIAWRTRLGFHVDVVSTADVPTTPNALFTWMNSYYQTADPALDYVVFVGDVDNPANIPCHFISPGVPAPIDPNIATDQKYTYDYTAGNDFANVLPRYFIGRLSVDSAIEARTVVNKIIQYESNPLSGDPNRWTRAVTVADASFAISTAQTQNWVRNKLLDNGFTNVQQFVRTQWQDPGGNAVLAGINNSVSWVAYRGFGSHSSWSGPYVFDDMVVSQMTNTNNLPVITSMVCGGGAFDEVASDPCYGETWLRLGTPSNVKGAVAFIAPSEIDTHTRWNNMVLAGWYTALFDQGLRTAGQCLVSAKVQLYNNYPLLWNPNGSNENSVWFYFHTYNILGDPALQLRAETPRVFDVTHATELSQSASHFQATVLDDSGLPVPEAEVVVTQNETVLLGVGKTNESGLASFELSSLPGDGTYELTVSRPEYVPYMTDLTPVGDRGLMLTSLTGSEQDTDDATNGDGFLNPGELVLPEATFQVVEPGGLQNAQVTISLPEGGGVVDVATESFGDLDLGDLVTLADARIRLNENLEDGAEVPVLMTLQSSTRQQSHRARLQPVRAPRLQVASTSFASDFGPGDTANLTINLSNLHEELGAGMVTGVLEFEDARISVVDGEGTWDELPANAEEVSNSDLFTVSVTGEAYPGRQVEATLTLTTTAGDVQVRPVMIVVDGASPETPTGPVGPGYYMYEDVDAGYDYLPDYEWQSIVGETGTVNLGISDRGNNEDETTVVNLPFDFPYWDDQFDVMSVCSNGWASFGETDLFFFRNRPIPGPLSPNGGLCVFWDDLVMNWSNSGVYSQYDDENGWYTIEWHNVRPYNSFSGSMSFQIRLFDPAAHGAPGGLGMIAFLYDDVVNNDGVENFSTIGLISPDGTEAMQVEFANTPAPTASGVAEGRQMLFAARGSAELDPPDLHILTPAIQLNAEAGGQSATHLRIANQGGRSARVHITGEGIGANWLPGGELDEHGGPDALGYHWYDSREFYGPSFNWIDIEEAGNEVALSGGGSAATAAISSEIDLPFDFSFYGADYSSIWVCEAGYLTFTNPGSNGLPTNTELPRTFSPRASIFAFWDDLSVGENGAIYVEVTDERAVITWSDLLHLNGDGEFGPYTFQLTLHPDGAIHVQYLDMNPRLDSATIGVQNELGTVGLMVSANAFTEEYIADDLALRFVPGLPWLTIAPGTTGIQGGNVATIELTANAEDVEPGLHSGRLLVRSAFTEEAFSVPIEFFVSDTPVGNTPAIRVDPFPGEAIPEDGSFTSFSLAPYVEDWDDESDQLEWLAFVDDALQVEVDDENIVTITPLAEWDGESDVTFRVRDDSYNHDDIHTTFRIGTENNSPRFTNVSPQSVGQILPDTEVQFTAEAEDPDGGEVSYRWYHGAAEIGTGTSVDVNFSWLGSDTIRVVADDGNGGSTTLFWSALVSSNDAEEPTKNLPTEYAIEALYPNPFNATMRMRYALPRATEVDVRVYNLLGQEVARRALGSMRAGRHELAFDASNWASGLYLIRWQAGSTVQVRKAVLMK
ncbi:T9SS type A sorting domain-containing protein [bacterium]|nr:T9SS type A sorting domain-containing protein [bacterium]